MEFWEIGEGTTPKEISDPNRFKALPTTKGRWAKVGAGVLVLFAVAFFNPFVGQQSGSAFALDSYVSSGRRFGVGSMTVFGVAGQKLHLSYEAKVKGGSMNIHVWPTIALPVSSLKTIRLDHSANARCDIVFPKTGLYRIEIDTFRADKSFDVDYEVAWYVW